MATKTKDGSGISSYQDHLSITSIPQPPNEPKIYEAIVEDISKICVLSSGSLTT